MCSHFEWIIILPLNAVLPSFSVIIIHIYDDDADIEWVHVSNQLNYKFNWNSKWIQISPNFYFSSNEDQFNEAMYFFSFKFNLGVHIDIVVVSTVTRCQLTFNKCTSITNLFHFISKIRKKIQWKLFVYWPFLTQI